jgi:hypothetical protein
MNPIFTIQVAERSPEARFPRCRSRLPCSVPHKCGLRPAGRPLEPLRPARCSEERRLARALSVGAARLGTGMDTVAGSVRSRRALAPSTAGFARLPHSKCPSGSTFDRVRPVSRGSNESVVAFVCCFCPENRLAIWQHVDAGDRTQL